MGSDGVRLVTSLKREELYRRKIKSEPELRSLYMNTLHFLIQKGLT